MHELAIADEIVREAKKRGAAKSIVVEVGELAKITPGELAETLANLVDWKVEIITKKAIVECKCGYVGRPRIMERVHDIVLFNCPECGGNPKIIEGDQILLKKCA
ncbi:MAG: hydrogenase/urease maturation nickel metallochaperone HypA [Candidatus Woesearchaeota archaeon]